MVLFKSDLISPLFQAVEAANLKTMQGEDDQHYLFLKRMVQILVELGKDYSIYLDIRPTEKWMV